MPIQMTISVLFKIYRLSCSKSLPKAFLVSQLDYMLCTANALTLLYPAVLLRWWLFLV